MKIVIVGCGNVGMAIVEQLSKEDHSIVVIDTEPKFIQKAIETYDVKGLTGNGANYDIQKEADVAGCDLLIACTASDELNILCCMVGKRLGAKDTIARIRNPEYFTLFIGNELGLSMMVNPEYEAAMEIFRILRFPSAIKIEPFADGKIELVELRLDDGNPLINVPLRTVQQKFQTKFLVCAIERNDKVNIPKGDATLLEDDKIHITASPKDVYSLFKKLGILQSNNKRVIIVGGSRIAYYLCIELKKLGINAKIIEKSEEKCHALAESLPRTEIIHGDGSDQEILMDEGLSVTDIVVTLTGNDEQNIMISLFAKEKGVKKVITKINQVGYASMLESSGIDSVVLPRVLTASQITRYVRGKENSGGSNIVSLYQMINGDAEALEFVASDKFPYLNQPIKTLQIKENVILASIIRKGVVITPNGNDVIEENDRVIIVTTQEQFDDLADILR